MSALPEPWRTLMDRVRKMEEQLRRLSNRSPFFGTGMHTNGAGGLDSDNFDATHGYSFKGDTGDAEFNGNVDVGGTLNVTGNTVIGGTLSLPAGIINNDALANPVASAVAHTDAQGFAVTTSNVQILSTSVPVPVGYSRALILNMSVAVTAYNNTANVDFLYCAGYVNGAGVGWQIGSMDVSAAGTGVAYDMLTTMLTGLAGGTITLTGKVSSAFGTWSASTSNLANLNASILFIR